MNDIKEQLIKNGFWNAVGTIINKFGSFILIIFLSRILMPEGFGKYSLVITLSFFLIVLSDMGIHQTLIRYVSLKIDDKKNSPAIYFRYLLKIKLFIIFLFSFLLLSISYPLSVYIFKETSLFLLFLIFVIPYAFFFSLTGFFECLFFIKKDVKYVSIIESIFMIIKFLGVLIIGYLINSNSKFILILLSFVLLSILIFLSILSFSKTLYPYLFKKEKGEIDKKEVKKFIFSLNIQTLSLLVLLQASIIILGIFLTDTYVGYYSSALVFITGLSNLFTFSYIFLPILSNMEMSQFQNFIKKIFRLLFLLILPISFGLSILSKSLIFTIYGESYIHASIPLSILSFLIPCIIGVDIAMLSFSAKNKQKKFSILMLFSALILIILNYIFLNLFLKISNEFAIIGVSIANLISWLFCFIFSIFLLKKEFNIQIFSSWIFKPIFSCLVMSLFLLFLLDKFGEMNLFKEIIIILICAIVYFFSLFLIKGIKKEEITSIIGLFFKKKINLLQH